MSPAVREKIESLRNLCIQHRVDRLDLFGSATGEDFDPEVSDLDFLVEFEPMSPIEHAASFFGLLADLERLFDRRIDLLEREPIKNPYLWKSIEQSRQSLYGAS